MTMVSMFSSMTFGLAITSYGAKIPIGQVGAFSKLLGGDYAN
jgi:hypothetical protein